MQPEGRGAAVPVNAADVREAITRAHQEEWERVIASLTKRFGDLDIAEEAAAEAFAAAVVRWPADGVPPNPGAWLTTTANRLAIDRIRRENKRGDKQKEAQLLHDDDPPGPLGAIDDDRRRRRCATAARRFQFADKSHKLMADGVRVGLRLFG